MPKHNATEYFDPKGTGSSAATPSTVSPTGEITEVSSTPKSRSTSSSLSSNQGPIAPLPTNELSSAQPVDRPEQDIMIREEPEQETNRIEDSVRPTGGPEKYGPKELKEIIAKYHMQITGILSRYKEELRVIDGIPDFLWRCNQDGWSDVRMNKLVRNLSIAPEDKKIIEKELGKAHLAFDNSNTDYWGFTDHTAFSEDEIEMAITATILDSLQALIISQRVLEKSISDEPLPKGESDMERYIKDPELLGPQRYDDSFWASQDRNSIDQEYELRHRGVVVAAGNLRDIVRHCKDSLCQGPVNVGDSVQGSINAGLQAAETKPSGSDKVNALPGDAASGDETFSLGYKSSD